MSNPPCDRRGFIRLAGIGVTALGIGALASCSSSTFRPEDYAGSNAPDAGHIERAMDAAIVAKGTVQLEVRRYPGNLKIPRGAVVHGAGEGKSIIGGGVTIGSRVRLKGFTVAPEGSHSTFVDGAHDSFIEHVTFTGGSTWANLYMNDRAAKDIVFTGCTFADNVRGGNGVRIVDKGTQAKHFENIRFESCHFFGNHRMNFECIQRADKGKPVVLGYRNIDLIDCDFAASGSINVSYDSGLLENSTKNHSSGYSIVRGCTISGGGFGLELAGAIEMLVRNNVIKDARDVLLSTSQLGSDPANSRFVGNTFSSHVSGSNVVFSGTGNSIRDNTVSTPGQVRFAHCEDSLVRGNTFRCIDEGPTVISIERSSGLEFVDNSIYGGAKQSVLQLGTSSKDNSFSGNTISQPGITFDLRDDTDIDRVTNTVDRTARLPQG